MKFAEEMLDALFDMELPLPRPVVRSLAEGIDSVLQKYAPQHQLRSEQNLITLKEILCTLIFETRCRRFRSVHIASCAGRQCAEKEQCKLSSVHEFL